MKELHKFGVWLKQIRANFLILAVLLVAIGLTFTYKYQYFTEVQFNIFHAVLVLIGVVTAHISVNLFNEYSDYKTKIDFNTERTPFSGGSGMLTEGYTNPKTVLFVSVFTLIISLIIGIYFTIVSHWTIGIIVALGAFAIVFYTNYLSKIFIGEFFAGLTLGSLVVIGTYIVMTATPQTPFESLVPKEIIFISIPPGLLTSLLLFLNEFPDTEADRQGGRYHLIVKLGKKTAAYVYTAVLVFTFGIILLLPILGISSIWVYIALLPIPIAIKTSIKTIKFGSNNKIIIPVLGNNVIIVLATDFLLAVSGLFQ